MLWVRDFNLHHPMWDEDCNTQFFMQANLDKAQCLIDAVAELNLQMALPKSLPTLHAMSSGNYTRPNNVFVSSSLSAPMVYCNMVPDERPARSDHMPIVMVLNMAPTTQTEKPRANYRAADLEAVRVELAVQLEGLDVLEDIGTTAEFDTRLHMFTHVLLETIDAKVPNRGPHPTIRGGGHKS